MTIPMIGEGSNITAARKRAEDAAAKRFFNATLPVYTADKRIPDQIGSCILICVSGSTFLVTAAHVVDECVEEGFFVGTLGAFVPISGSASLTAQVNGKRDDDHLDIAVIPLDEKVLAELNGVPVIEEWMIDWNPTAQPGHLFMAIGYPNSRNKLSYRGGDKVTANAVAHTDAIATDEVTAKKLPENGRHHLFLRYGRRAIDEAGDAQNAIKPRGLSGGPVIDLGKLSSPDVLENRASTFPKLAAIVTERGIGLNLVCTKMTVVRHVLEATGRLGS